MSLLALIWPSANILNLSEPAVKNLNWSLSSPALFSALILVSWSTSITPPNPFHVPFIFINLKTIVYLTLTFTWGAHKG